jgi:hypothetical protein
MRLDETKIVAGYSFCGCAPKCSSKFSNDTCTSIGNDTAPTESVALPTKDWAEEQPEQTIARTHKAALCTRCAVHSLANKQWVTMT